ncbi:MAG TPA: glycosyltransferase [Bryobacteraceae bacterium]|nr:glycosyltransferase [Bryobacteraceae bacterium]
MSSYEPQRRRILQVLPVIGFAGAEQMAAHLAAGLVAEHEVAAVGLYESVDSPTETVMRKAGVRIWFLGKRPGFDPRMYAQLARVLREFCPHLVHTHLSVLRYLLPSLIARREIVAIHTLHSLAPRETDRLGRMVRRVALGRCVIPVAVSRAVARSVVELYGGAEPVTIPNGIPVCNFRFDASARREWRAAQGFEQDAFLFLATGRLEVPKSPVRLLRAFAELVRERCYLLFAGDGPLRPTVEEEIRRLTLENRVRLLGRRGDVPECLSAVDAFVLCSDWEGNPLGLMEAMACGLPVIATSVGGVPELVQDRRHGLLVEAGDAAALTSAMRAVLDSAELRRALGEAARRRARAEFTVDRMVESYSRLYRTVLVGQASDFQTVPA